MTWEGAIIDESLDNKRIYNLIKTTKTTITPLTGEEEKGDIHLHEIEIEDKNKEEFVKICKQDIKYGWYIDISKDKGTEKQRTIIIFKDKEF
ncbi:MAG: hypothetical protein KJ906_03855, partial [Nanoarchaeota archaeon]|nr:hypothetical protein [Nanoarchaeota archaeon]